MKLFIPKKQSLNSQEIILRNKVKCGDCGHWVTSGIKRTRCDSKGNRFVDYICVNCIANIPDEKLRKKIVNQKLSF